MWLKDNLLHTVKFILCYSTKYVAYFHRYCLIPEEFIKPLSNTCNPFCRVWSDWISQSVVSASWGLTGARHHTLGGGLRAYEGEN